MKTVFGPIGDSDVISLTASSQTFALDTMAATNPAIRIVALNPTQLAWYLKFGTSGAVTVSRTDGMRIEPGSKEVPSIIPVPTGSTHVAILAEGATGNALLSYGGFDNGEFSPVGASQVIAVTSTDQRIALPAMAAEQPAIRLVSTSQAIEALWVKLGNSGVTGSMTTSMKIFPGSVNDPTLIPVTNGETHLSIFCEGAGGGVVLTPGGIETGITIPVYTAGPGIDITAFVVSAKFTRRTITNIAAGDTITTADRAQRIRITGSSSGTLALQAIATLGNGFFCWVHNDGTGDVTLDPSGSEQIDGLTSWILYPGGVILLQVTASDITTVLLAPMSKIFTASGTLTKPGCGKAISGRAYGGGASGGRGGANDGGAGGGGGSCVFFDLPLTAMGTTETVTIGAGGTAATVDNTAGNAGGNTTLGSLVTAYGGGAGDGISVNPGGGGGGGTTSVGTSVSNSADGGNGGSPLGGDGGGGGNESGGDSTYGGGGGGSGMNAATGLRGGDSVWGGGGGSGGAGAATSPGRGGNSVYGGAGGGGGSDSGTPGAGGTSIYGGNGGAGATGAAAATAGTAPSGGGGGSESGNSGAGARGELRVTIS